MWNYHIDNGMFLHMMLFQRNLIRNTDRNITSALIYVSEFHKIILEYHYLKSIRNIPQQILAG